MKSVDPAVKTAIRQGHTLHALPRLIAEWNLNRHAEITLVENEPTEYEEGLDPDLFPIESVVQPMRPARGIVKARNREGRIAHDYDDAQYAVDYEDPQPDNHLFVIADQDDTYKYWTNPRASETTLSDEWAGYELPAGYRVNLRAEFAAPVQTNKIVVGFETSLSAPETFHIDILVDGVWQINVAHEGKATPERNSHGFGRGDGRVEFYYDGLTWDSAAENREAAQDMNTPTVEIQGIRLVVRSMARADAFCSIIELSPRLERDLTPYLISADDSFTMSDVSFIAPLGRCSSNTANVTLSNIDYTFSNYPMGIGDQPFLGLIDANVNLNLEYVYEIAGTKYAVQQFNMFTETWNGQADDTVTVQLRDASKFLQEIKPQAALYQSWNDESNRISIGEVIRQICTSVGYNNLADDFITGDDDNVHVDIFWTDGEKTVWEIFTELAEGTQTAIFFDAYGKLQMFSRTKAYDAVRPVDWTLRAEDEGLDLADIETLTQTDTFEANKVTVNYQTTEFSDFNKGFPKLETVWEPEGTVTLRSSNLKRSLEHTDDYLWLTPADAKIWPYEGVVQIEGEFIRYSGKRYVYYEGNDRRVTYVTSNSEKKKLDAKAWNRYRHKNKFTGGLRITERGLWNSEKQVHRVEVNWYWTRKKKGNVRVGGVAGFRHWKSGSSIGLRTHKGYGWDDFLISTRGADEDHGYYHLGTRMRFEKGSYRNQQAGITFQNWGVNEAGYYVELRPTKKIGKSGRKKMNELRFFSLRDGNGKMYFYGGQQIDKKDGGRTSLGRGKTWVQRKGVPVHIAEDIWYDIDITINRDGDDDLISIAINGVNQMTARVPAGSGNKQPFSGRFGLYARGHTHARWEYLYAINKAEDVDADHFGYLDRVKTGYSSGQWDREFVYRLRRANRRSRRRRRGEELKYAGRFFDEMGPVVHEVREFDVKYDKSPVLHSRLYLSNESQVICPEFIPTAFGAKFILANTHRENAIVNGEDNLTFRNNPVQQRMLLYGRAVIQKEAESVTATHKQGIAIRGTVETEVHSEWIQNKGDAKNLADWITEHWGRSNDEMQAQIFGNPLIEVGDVVAIEYAERAMTAATHNYVVVEASTSFEEGMGTTLTLRRINKP